MTTHLFTTTADALAHFEDHAPLAPGDQGFWKVWGARVADIRTGDLVATKDGDDLTWDLILGTFEAKAAPLRRGFLTEAGQVTFGALLPVIVLRWDTHNILA